MTGTAVSVLIVSWQSCEATLRAVEAALEATSHVASDVVVVDNASSDGTPAALRDRFGSNERVTLLLNATNEGFARGNNQALAASAGETVVVCNPDLLLRRTPLDALLTLVREPGVGAATGALVGLDGRPQTLHRALPSLPIVAMTQTRPGAALDHRLLRRRWQRRYRLRDRPRSGIAEIPQAAGALVVLHRTVIDGPLRGVLFDERLPLLVNDVDLSRRVRDAGLRVVVDWDASFVHEGGVSLRQLAPDTVRAERWDGLERYYAAHEPRWRGLALRALRAVALAPTVASPRSDDQTGPDDDLVSIVVPAYNYAAFLPEALDSALAQTHADIEVLVVDDGSTDDTSSVLAAYGDRIRVHRQPNRGLSAARNEGARLARGRYVVFLDADNRLRPTFVERCLGALDAHPVAGFAYPQAHHFGEVDVVTTHAPYDLDVLRERNVIDACALIRRELVLAHPYDESNRVGWEDWDFYLTLAEHGWGGVLVDEPLLEYRRHGGSMTSAIDRVERRELRWRIHRRHRRLVGTRRLLREWWQLQRHRLGRARRRALDR
jgi:GT2 family glycosyltransferase